MNINLTSLNGQQVSLVLEALNELKGNIRGQVVTPDDSEYDSVREIWNAMIDRRPGLIVRCMGTADVMRSVQFARKHNLRISIRGAGHNIAGKSLQDDAMLIDLSMMRSVLVDPFKKIAVAGPGATLGDVDHETQAFGLAVPTGINSTTGIAGLTLGGGFGWLSRSYGLTADNLIGAKVVNAEGELLHCDENTNSDLFWAIRGGGGNYGIVTSFKFRLHPVGPEVMSGAIIFPIEQASDVLRKYKEFCATCPEELTVWAVLRDAPPLPFLDPEWHGKRVLILPALYNGPMEEGEKLLSKLNDLGQPIANGISPHPFAGFQQAFDPLLTPGARNYWKSHNFTELNDNLIDSIVEYGKKLPSSDSEIFIAQMGGATNRVATDATAYPHRDVEFIMNVHTRWNAADDDINCINWAKEFYEATESFATGGVYVNFISEGEDRVKGAYGSNYEQLANIKSKYDPDNFFSINQNVNPA